MTPSTADLVVIFIVAFFLIIGLALLLGKFVPDCREKRIKANANNVKRESDVESGRSGSDSSIRASSA